MSPNLCRVSIQVEARRAECLRQLINNISVDTTLQYYSTADVCTENRKMHAHPL